MRSRTFSGSGDESQSDNLPSLHRYRDCSFGIWSDGSNADLFFPVQQTVDLLAAPMH